MSNVNAPNGLAPVRTIINANWSQSINLYVIPSGDTSQYGVGDIVLSKAGSDVNGVPYIKKATASSVPRGILIGVDPVLQSGVSLVGSPLTLETIAIPATKTKDYYVYVVDDPNIIFEIQGDNTTTLTAASFIGLNANPVIANPATGSPFSGTVLNTATVATTNTFMMKILSLTYKPGADFTAYTRFLCKWNAHEFYGLTTGAT